MQYSLFCLRPLPLVQMRAEEGVSISLAKLSGLDTLPLDKSINLTDTTP